MSVSVFDLFSIGIGPSSSHTVGPMRAANSFVTLLSSQLNLSEVVAVQATIYGSLAWTGKGHGTDLAVLLGLEGYAPETIDPTMIPGRVEAIKSQRRLFLGQQQEIEFDYFHDLILNKKEVLPYHSNGMQFSAYDADKNLILEKIYYSVGGGFVVEDAQHTQAELSTHTEHVKFPFSTAKDLFAHCEKEGKRIVDIMIANETCWRSEAQVREETLKIWHAMQNCIKAGCENEGVLPGGLNVKRRAPALYRKLAAQEQQLAAKDRPNMDGMNWVSCYAIAVNEENAAGGRVVTAPTNGAAGLIPAVLNFFVNFNEDVTDDHIIEFLLTAGAIGILYKLGASISAAEVGCQGEVGVACSMAAGAFAAVKGGTLQQIENAAEMGMEHHLGLTCDPIGGLVQIPCIERNAMGAVQAISSAKLSLLEQGDHAKIPLDNVIKTMRDTGQDMHRKYKETALGGLALNLPEC